jgi:hypothetical protein
MISRSAVISRPVKTGETPPNEWDMAHVRPVHPVANGQVVDAPGNVTGKDTHCNSIKLSGLGRFF